MTVLSRLQDWARRLKRETLALYLAARHPQTPWLARWIIAGLVAYALSPIDLIPDFIPILGYLDDLILLPLGFALVLRLIPHAVMVECRQSADQRFASGKPVSQAAGLLIVAIWLLGLWGLWKWLALPA